MKTITLQNRQLKVMVDNLVDNQFDLPVLAVCTCPECQQGTRAGRLTNNLIKFMHVDAWVLQFGINTNDMNVITIFLASGVVVEVATGITANYPSPFTDVTVNAAIDAAVGTYATGQGYVIDNIIHTVNPLPSASVPSYQTIVSQTGTAAPAVAGGFSPINTLPGAPTFTWARTGAGVYTLTASSAVFSTSGKTGVFIAPLTNLNASVRGVVTSSTVVTFTTAVQSVAILGLLGLTATPTDALLSNTMIFIQAYS